jgi:glutamine amidotransferase PdxT
MADVKIGVLALQGAFREHIQRLNSIDGVTAVAVRTGVRTTDDSVF